MSNWKIDSHHSDVLFSIKHLGISTVRGKFNTVSGEASFDPADLSKLELSATIDVASVDTGNHDRDEHLKKADFFDVETYPTITFVSKSVVNKSADNHHIVGDLTIHGVTKEVTLDV